MIKDGDRVLVGLSGGKDSLSLLHILLALKRKAPIHFEVGACTVDPQTPEYNPSILKEYLKTLGVPYFYESQGIIEQATCSMDEKKASICSFCSRMKRGILYTVCKRENYSVLALGQHLDDQAESLLMSAFHNGQLRTMKAHYRAREHNVRIVRPLNYAREAMTREYAEAAGLPVITDNCPGCFEAPKVKTRQLWDVRGVGVAGARARQDGAGLAGAALPRPLRQAAQDADSDNDKAVLASMCVRAAGCMRGMQHAVELQRAVESDVGAASGSQAMLPLMASECEAEAPVVQELQRSKHSAERLIVGTQSQSEGQGPTASTANSPSPTSKLASGRGKKGAADGQQAKGRHD
eukprot:725391-Rhodomonas_salina.1